MRRDEYGPISLLITHDSSPVACPPGQEEDVPGVAVDAAGVERAPWERELRRGILGTLTIDGDLVRGLGLKADGIAGASEDGAVKIDRQIGRREARFAAGAVHPNCSARTYTADDFRDRPKGGLALLSIAIAVERHGVEAEHEQDRGPDDGAARTQGDPPSYPHQYDRA